MSRVAVFLLSLSILAVVVKFASATCCCFEIIIDHYDNDNERALRCATRSLVAPSHDRWRLVVCRQDLAGWPRWSRPLVAVVLKSKAASQ